MYVAIFYKIHCIFLCNDEVSYVTATIKNCLPSQSSVVSPNIQICTYRKGLELLCACSHICKNICPQATGPEGIYNLTLTVDCIEVMVNLS